MRAGVDVRIHYDRPPNRRQVFEQRIVHATETVVVTYAAQARLDGPIRVDGRTILEDSAPVVWFTFPGEWHDIGRFHRADGRFTGVYANILTPVRFLDDQIWQTLDLFLDLWLPLDGEPKLLDEDEFEEAASNRWLDEPTIGRARAEAARLLRLARSGDWPPQIVREWTLGRVRARLASR